MVQQHFAVFIVSQALPLGMDAADVEVEGAFHYSFNNEDSVPESVEFVLDEESGQYFPRQYINYHVVTEIHNGQIELTLSPQWEELFTNQPELLMAAIDQLLGESVAENVEADASTTVGPNDMDVAGTSLDLEFQALLDARAPIVEEVALDPSIVSTLELARFTALIREDLGEHDDVVCVGVFSIQEVEG
jgi:hypothetical protein